MSIVFILTTGLVCVGKRLLVAASTDKGAEVNRTAAQKAFNTFADPPRFELYDLETDPIEFHNLAGEPGLKAVEERLKEALLKYRRNTDDPFLGRDMIQKMIAHAGG